MKKITKIAKNKMRRSYGLASGMAERILPIFQTSPEFFSEHKQTKKFLPGPGCGAQPIGAGFLSPSTVKLWELDFKELKQKNPNGYRAKISETQTCYIIEEEVSDR